MWSGNGYIYVALSHVLESDKELKTDLTASFEI